MSGRCLPSTCFVRLVWSDLRPGVEMHPARQLRTHRWPFRNTHARCYFSSCCSQNRRSSLRLGRGRPQSVAGRWLGSRRNLFLEHDDRRGVELRPVPPLRPPFLSETHVGANCAHGPTNFGRSIVDLLDSWHARNQSNARLPLCKTLRNPQPVASRVLHKLLRWIEAVDLASQQGAPRPAFAAEDGSPIFPLAGDPDELWRACLSNKS